MSVDINCVRPQYVVPQYGIALNKKEMIYFLLHVKYSNELFPYVNCQQFEEMKKKLLTENGKVEYNIKIFRTIIEGMITKNSNHLNLDYVLDCLNEVFKAMVNYQNLSLELLKDTEGQSARDRLTKIDTLCKQKLRENHTLKDEIVNEQLPVYLVRIKLHELVSMMVETYKDYLSHNIQVMIQKNPNLIKNIHSIYNIGNIQQQMTIEEFTIIFMDSIKINN